MRRSIVLLLALVAVASLGPARAAAAKPSPCRDKIFNEWYHDGKISSTFPLSCYRDALKHIPADVAVYSSLSDDIRLALQAAVDRSHGKSVPSEVGDGTRLTSSSASTGTSTTPTSTSSQSTTTPGDTAPNSPDPGTTTPTSSTPVAAPSTSSSSSSVPLPVLVLGGVALLLVASGAVGLGVRRYRRGHTG